MAALAQLLVGFLRLLKPWHKMCLALHETSAVDVQPVNLVTCSGMCVEPIHDSVLQYVCQPRQPASQKMDRPGLKGSVTGEQAG